MEFRLGQGVGCGLTLRACACADMVGGFIAGCRSTTSAGEIGKMALHKR